MPRASYLIPPEDGKVYVLDNAEVERLLPLQECMAAMEDAYREWQLGNAAIRPKKSVHVYNAEEDTGYRFVSFDGGVQKMGIYAIRMRSDLSRGVGFRPGEPRDDFVPEGQRRYCGLVLLFSSKTGLPLAMVPDGYIQHARVASVAGIAAKYLARQDSQVLGILGSQWMARLHARAICAVRPIKSIKVYSPNPANREAFAREMGEELDIEVVAKDGPEEVVRGSAILACCTDARAPVFEGAWLEEGTYICNVLGSELGPDARARVDYAVAHQPLIFNETLGAAGAGETPVAVAGKPPEGTNLEIGMRRPGSVGSWSTSDIQPETPLLSQVLTAQVPGRTDDRQIIFFNNNEGTGIQFASAGEVILRNLAAIGFAGVRTIPLDWFLQDIPD